METEQGISYISKICPWCGIIFRAVSEDTVYCKKNHKTAARRSRAKGNNPERFTVDTKRTELTSVEVPREVLAPEPSPRQLRAVQKSLDMMHKSKHQPHRRQSISYYVKKEIAAEASQINASAVCPHPHKKAFSQPILAWEWIDTAHPDDDEIYPYKCGCGTIHIGHGSGHDAIKREDINVRMCLRCYTFFYSASETVDYCVAHQLPVDN